MKGAIYNESPEERLESFHRRMEAIERRRLKEEFEFYEKRDIRAFGEENNGQENA